MAAIKVHGLDELRNDLKRIDRALPRELRKVNKSAAQIVEVEAERRVPVRSGRLRRSIGVKAQTTGAAVKAGSGVRVPYAGPIHWGWPRHNIEGVPFIWSAAQDKRDEVADHFEQGVVGVIEQAGIPVD